MPPTLPGELTSVAFDDRYWSVRDQPLIYRHRVALEWCGRGPVLDIGCGDGLMLDLLTKKGVEAIGLDHSPIAAKKCREKNLRVYPSFAELPIQNFRITLLMEVLEHLYDPGTMLDLVQSEYLIISVPNFCSLPARLQVLFGGVPENNKPRKGHVYWFTLDGLRSMIESHGYNVSEVRCNTQRGLNRLGKWFPSLFGLGFVVLCRRKNALPAEETKTAS